MENEIATRKHLQNLAWQAVLQAETHGGIPARGWAKIAFDFIKADNEELFPEENWDV